MFPDTHSSISNYSFSFIGKKLGLNPEDCCVLICPNLYYCYVVQSQTKCLVTACLCNKILWFRKPVSLLSS